MAEADGHGDEADDESEPQASAPDAPEADDDGEEQQ